VWWFTPVIPALGRLRQEAQEFQASLGFMAGACLKKDNCNIVIILRNA
jgi:hypothetical protein